MKTLPILSYACLFLSLILASCTVEKRLYMPGYHFNWKNRGQKANKHEFPRNDIINNVEGEKTFYTDESCDISKNSDDNTEHEILMAYTGNSESINGTKFLETASTIPLNILNDYKNNFTKTVKKEVEKPMPPDSGPKTHGLAIASEILGILSVLALIPINGVYVFAPLAFILCIPAIIFGFIALNKIQKYPDKYKGKAMARIGLVFGFISLIILVLILLMTVVFGYMLN
ncbi:MAG: DUF4190 domain-containing protein [Bacteroidia bacterium]|nr:DUF4190 domain-containing protein [Bacteroidia bacterium]